jgi:hypothetical protein
MRRSATTGSSTAAVNACSALHGRAPGAVAAGSGAASKSESSGRARPQSRTRGAPRGTVYQRRRAHPRRSGRQKVSRALPPAREPSTRAIRARPASDDGVTGKTRRGRSSLAASQTSRTSARDIGVKTAEGDRENAEEIAERAGDEQNPAKEEDLQRLLRIGGVSRTRANQREKKGKICGTVSRARGWANANRRDRCEYCGPYR